MLVNSTQIRPVLVSYNVEQDRAASDVATDIAWLVSNCAPDLIGLQEMGQFQSVLDSLPAGYAYAAPLETLPAFGVRKNAIVYKTASFTLQESHSMMLADASPTHDFGNMFCNFARFKETTDGNYLWYHNGHLDPNWAGGHPVDTSARTRACIQALETFCKTVRAHAAGDQLVAWCGDFNSDWWTDVPIKDPDLPYAMFKKYGLVNLFTPLGTTSAFHTWGTIALDYMGIHKSDGRTAAFSVANSGSSLGSDHRAVKGEVNITRIAGTHAPGDTGKPATCIV